MVIKMNLCELENKCRNCTDCELANYRTNTVFGVGCENAKIMLIGEAPGANEDLQGEPFVGRSGKLLDEFLESAGFSRNKNVYIANTTKCRPPENRDPKPAETAACKKWLDAQIEIIKPKIIVCVGRIAAQKIIDKNIKVTKQHGEFTEKDGIFYTATYHPAAVLRNINNKTFALEDWQKIKDRAIKLGVKI